MDFRRFLYVGGLVILGILTWRVTDKLTSDATAMAVGLFFGILAGVPTALILMNMNKNNQARTQDNYQEWERRRQLENQKPAQANLFLIGSVNVNQGGLQTNQPQYKEEPFTVVPNSKAIATKPVPLSVETDHEWRDEPYPIVKR